MASVYDENCINVLTRMQVIVFMILCLLPHTLLAEVNDVDLTEESERQNGVKINKCCEENELMIQRGFKTVCTLLKQMNQSTYIHIVVYSFLLGRQSFATTCT